MAEEISIRARMWCRMGVMHMQAPSRQGNITLVGNGGTSEAVHAVPTEIKIERSDDSRSVGKNATVM